MRFIEVNYGSAFVMALSTMTLFCGCSKEETVPVVEATGIVTIKGEPAADVMVRFVPDGEELEGLVSSSGVSDATGKFEFVASDGRKGAIAGPGKILVTDLNEDRPAQGEAPSKPPRFSPQYGVLGPRSLTATIAAGETVEVNIPVR